MRERTVPVVMLVGTTIPGGSGGNANGTGIGTRFPFYWTGRATVMLLNKYCLIAMIMACLATFWWPVGLLIDIGIVASWIYLKVRKKNVGRGKATPLAGIGMGASTDEMLKVMLVQMMARQLGLELPVDGKALTAGDSTGGMSPGTIRNEKSRNLGAKPRRRPPRISGESHDTRWKRVYLD